MSIHERISIGPNVCCGQALRLTTVAIALAVNIAGVSLLPSCKTKPTNQPPIDIVTLSKRLTIGQEELDLAKDKQTLSAARELYRHETTRIRGVISRHERNLPELDADRWCMTYTKCWLRIDYVQSRKELLSVWRQRWPKGIGNEEAEYDKEQGTYIHADSSPLMLYRLYQRTRDKELLRALLKTQGDGHAGETLAQITEHALRRYSSDTYDVSTGRLRSVAAIRIQSVRDR